MLMLNFAITDYFVLNKYLQIRTKKNKQEEEEEEEVRNDKCIDFFIIILIKKLTFHVI
jgi:hypothetical protein